MTFGRTTALVAFAAAAALGISQPVAYAGARVKVKAGTLLIASQQANSAMWDPEPHVWYNLDQDATVKPSAWSFDNPVAQSALNADARTRWLAITGSAPAIGTRVTKRDAPYWEVNISTADIKTLAQFNILLLPLGGGLSLNSKERERLRAYMDQGGILWVDVLSGAALDLANLLPLSFGITVSSGAIDANLDHPLLRYPNAMTLDDVRRLQTYTNSIVATTVDVSASGLDPILSWIGPDSYNLEPVAGVTPTMKTISVGHVGNGYMVVTTRGVSATINRGLNKNLASGIDVNTGYSGLDPIQDSCYYSAAKFIVNAISLNSTYRTTGAGSNKLGSNSVDIPPPLIRRFVASSSSIGALRSPAIYNGYVAETNGTTVAVFDAKPEDRTKDDPGLPGNLVWQANGGASLSAPTIVSAPNTTLVSASTGKAAVNQIWATDYAGKVHVWELETGAVLATITPPSATYGDSDGPYPPTVHEGMVFITDTRSSDQAGRVWVCDLNTGKALNTGQSTWSIEGSGRLTAPSASPTVGYIPIKDNSGGLDRVVYVPTKNSTSTSPHPAGLVSLWLGARGESPVKVTLQDSTHVRLTLRANLNGLPVVVSPTSGFESLGIKVTPLKPNGDPFTYAEMQQYFTGHVSQSSAGEILVDLKGATSTWDWDGTNTAGNTSDDVGWRVDYTIDWGAVSTFGGIPADSYVRGDLQFPDDSSNSRRVMGPLALSTNGNLYAVTAPTSGSGGSLFALREEGRGDFKLAYRWDLHEALTIKLNDAGGNADNLSYREALVDEDGITTAFSFLASHLTSAVFATGPTVKGDTVYVGANCNKTVFGTAVATGALLAFKAEMPTIQFEMSGSTDGMSLLQPDVARSSSKTTPETYSALSTGYYTVDPIDVGATKSRVSIDSLMTVQRGRIRDSFSTSLPVIVRRSGQTDVVYEPEAPSNLGNVYMGNARGKYDPLRWYVVFNGYKVTAPPLVTGSTLYLPGASLLPKLTVSGFSNLSFTGLVYGMDAQISPSDSFLHADSVWPWRSQLYTLDVTNGWKGSTAIKWPQFKGITSWDDFRVRLLQAALSTETSVTNVVGGEDTILATGASSLHGFNRSDFFVADEGRVSRFDAAGNPVWSTDQTLSSGSEGPITPATTNKTLSYPTRVYPADDGAWIVDTGNNRVVHIDSGAHELRSVTGFKVHPCFAPRGLGESESRQLKQPRDVMVYSDTHTAAEVSAAFPGENNPDGIGPERWVHMLIADAGNSRVVELIDRLRIDPTTGQTIGFARYIDPSSPNTDQTEFASGILWWHTPEELSGKHFAYNSIDRVYVGSSTTRHAVYVFGFGNVQPGKGSFGSSTVTDQDVSSGYSGVVILDGDTGTVVRDFTLPAVPAGAFLVQDTSGNFSFSSSAAAASTHKISGLNSVTVRNVTTSSGGTTLALMICESTGIYELTQAIEGTDNPWSVRWMLPMDAYVGMRRPSGTGPFTASQLSSNPQRLRAAYARRLDSGDVLFVNSYYGNYFGGGYFSGEVGLIDGTIGGTDPMPGYDVSRQNLGFNSLSLIYQLPPIQGIRGLVNPVFVERP